jgi:hypothetical protein
MSGADHTKESVKVLAGTASRINRTGRKKGT